MFELQISHYLRLDPSGAEYAWVVKVFREVMFWMYFRSKVRNIVHLYLLHLRNSFILNMVHLVNSYIHYTYMNTVQCTVQK